MIESGEPRSCAKISVTPLSFGAGVDATFLTFSSLETAEELSDVVDSLTDELRVVDDADVTNGSKSSKSPPPDFADGCEREETEDQRGHKTSGRETT